MTLYLFNRYKEKDARLLPMINKVTNIVYTKYSGNLLKATPYRTAATAKVTPNKTQGGNSNQYRNAPSIRLETRSPQSFPTIREAAGNKGRRYCPLFLAEREKKRKVKGPCRKTGKPDAGGKDECRKQACPRAVETLSHKKSEQHCKGPEEG